MRMWQLRIESRATPASTTCLGVPGLWLGQRPLLRATQALALAGSGPAPTHVRIDIRRLSERAHFLQRSCEAHRLLGRCVDPFEPRGVPLVELVSLGDQGLIADGFQSRGTGAHGVGWMT
jgi:hypothetical protein